MANRVNNFFFFIENVEQAIELTRALRGEVPAAPAEPEPAPAPEAAPAEEEEEEEEDLDEEEEAAYLQRWPLDTPEYRYDYPMPEEYNTWLAGWRALKHWWETEGERFFWKCCEVTGKREGWLPGPRLLNTSPYRDGTEDPPAFDECSWEDLWFWFLNYSQDWFAAHERRPYIRDDAFPASKKYKKSKN